MIKNLIDFETIKKVQIKEKCSICNLAYFGPVNKCNHKNCSKKFHPECARINNYFLEVFVEKEIVTLF